MKSDERRRGEVEEDTDHDEDEEEEEEQEVKSRSSRRARASKDQENKENSRAKGKRLRGGEDNEEDDLDLNVGEMDELLKGELRIKYSCRICFFNHKFSFSLISSSSLPALMKHKDGWPFDRPITKQDAPDYHLCVKTPIDLSTIRFSIFVTRDRLNLYLHFGLMIICDRVLALSITNIHL